MQVIGIDPSLTATAIASESGVQVVKSESRGKCVVNRFARYEQLVADIAKAICKADLRVYLEGYSYGSKGSSVVTLGEFGALLRKRLLEFSDAVIEIPPPTLKKFATGKGTSSKVAVAGAIAKRYGVTFDTDDAFDAFGLYMLGRCCEGLDEPQTAFQREVVEAIRGKE